MKQRILVLNGQRLLENFENDEWKTIKTYKFNSLPGGVYNIFAARDGEKEKNSEGLLVHASENEFYLKSAFGMLKYEINEYLKLPGIGSFIKVAFDENKQIIVNTVDQKQTHKLTR